MNSPKIKFVEFDEVNDAVSELLEAGCPVEDISLRKIREAMGDRGSLQTISKYFAAIKSRLERGEKLDASHLTDTDMDALKNVVGDIVNRRSWAARSEKEAADRAAAELTQRHEAELAIKNEIIEDFEHQVAAMEEGIATQTCEIEERRQQVMRLEGMIQALQATIATLSHLNIRSSEQNTNVGDGATSGSEPGEHSPGEAGRETRGSAAARRLVEGIDEDNVDADDES
ncbi:DNA-binding protein [Stakelama marina]|uniref:DNA-binding protein n=1 Tax=Stakelama marina TaxID=2826939 RepID=A0A8T4I9N6_9SPHN|nr:DNA-binding protein [Stakelama marina]MBR0551063.1 DNA-binding protein [Stakelama marina]